MGVSDVPKGGCLAGFMFRRVCSAPTDTRTAPPPAHGGCSRIRKVYSSLDASIPKWQAYQDCECTPRISRRSTDPWSHLDPLPGLAPSAASPRATWPRWANRFTIDTRGASHLQDRLFEVVYVGRCTAWATGWSAANAGGTAAPTCVHTGRPPRVPSAVQTYAAIEGPGAQVVHHLMASSMWQFPDAKVSV